MLARFQLASSQRRKMQNLERKPDRPVNVPAPPKTGNRGWEHPSVRQQLQGLPHTAPQQPRVRQTRQPQFRQVRELQQPQINKEPEKSPAKETKNADKKALTMEEILVSETRFISFN